MIFNNAWVAMLCAFVRNLIYKFGIVVREYSVLNNIPEAIAVVSTSGYILNTNNMFEKLSGYSHAELRGMKVSELITMDNATLSVKDEPKLLHKSGIDMPVEVSSAISKGLLKTTLVMSVKDITERLDYENMIYHLAYYDTLTGLPNRRYFNDRIDEAIANANTTTTELAVLMIDVDDFKRINDTHGHHIGDDVLRGIGDKIQSALTAQTMLLSNKSPNMFCARLGGDEFVVFIEGISCKKHIEQIAEAIIAQISIPIITNGHQIFTKTSIGIGRYPIDGNTSFDLLKSADLALYESKQLGKNQYHFHHSIMADNLAEYVEYESAIRYFIDTGNFDVHYQPIIDTKSSKIISAEALFRGNPEKYPNINIEQLIKIAENNGMINSLGPKIFKRALEDCGECSASGISVAINISIRELSQLDFVQQYMDMVHASGTDPKNVTIEITESVLMTEQNHTARKLNQLKELGINTAIDDFGKGYSSISYLRCLPSVILKLDSSFISNINDSDKTRAIVSGITQMSHQIGMSVCAEGVEELSQYQTLVEIGVDRVQGYLVSEPVSAAKLAHMLEHPDAQFSPLENR